MFLNWEVQKLWKQWCFWNIHYKCAKGEQSNSLRAVVSLGIQKDASCEEEQTIKNFNDMLAETRNREYKEIEGEALWWADHSESIVSGQDG